MCNTPHIKHLVRDEWSGRYFEGTMFEIQQAVNEVNAFMIGEGDVDLNTFYDRLGLEVLPQGAEVGWSGEAIDIVYGSGLTGPSSPYGVPEGVPYISMAFRREPRPSFGVSVG